MALNNLPDLPVKVWNVLKNAAGLRYIGTSIPGSCLADGVMSDDPWRKKRLM